MHRNSASEQDGHACEWNHLGLVSGASPHVVAWLFATPPEDSKQGKLLVNEDERAIVCSTLRSEMF